MSGRLPLGRGPGVVATIEKSSGDMGCGCAGAKWNNDEVRGPKECGPTAVPEEEPDSNYVRLAGFLGRKDASADAVKRLHRNLQRGGSE